MSLFSILQNILDYSFFIIATVLSFFITEVCLRLTFKQKKKRSFWKSSFIVAVSTLVVTSILFWFFSVALQDWLMSILGDVPFMLALVHIAIPISLGLLIGYSIAMKFDPAFSKKTHPTSVLIANFITTLVLTIFGGVIVGVLLFASFMSFGIRLIDSTHETFHYFNQHVRNLCLNTTCPERISDIKAFDPKRFNYLALMTSIQYQKQGEHEYYFSVRFNSHQVLSSTHYSDWLANTEAEAKQKGLWN